jgi:hypothetical protein
MGDWGIFCAEKSSLEEDHLDLSLVRPPLPGPGVSIPWTALEYLKIISPMSADLPEVVQLLQFQQTYDVQVVIVGSGKGIDKIQELVAEHNDGVPRLFVAFDVVERRGAWHGGVRGETGRWIQVSAFVGRVDYGVSFLRLFFLQLRG